MKDKQVLLLGPTPPPHGGIATYCKDIINSYLKEKYKMIFFDITIPENYRPTYNTNNKIKNIIIRDGFLSSIKQIIFVIKNFFKFYRCINKNNFNTIHIISCTGLGFWRNGLFILISKFKNVQSVFHVVGEIDVFWDKSNFIKKKLIRFFLNKSNIIIVQSDGIRKKVSKMTVTDIKYIINGTNTDLFTKNKNKIEKSSKFNIITIGVLGRRKGYYDIIKCASEIKKNNINDIHFKFVGGGEVSLFKKLVIENNLDDMICVHGNVSEKDKIELLQKSDLFLLPTYNEGQPIAIIEAICCGLPIISTNVGAIPEIVLSNNGTLLNPGDLNKITESILEYYEDRKLTEIISNNNYSDSIKRFSFDRVFKELDFIYNQLEIH